MSKIIKYFGSGNWIENGISSSFEDAELVVMPGGGDWNPNLYGQKENSFVRYWSDKTDQLQMQIINDAIKAGKAIFGICRGLSV